MNVINLGGYCQRGVFSLVFIPPFDTKFIICGGTMVHRCNNVAPLNLKIMGELDKKYLQDMSPSVDGSGNAPKNWRDITDYSVTDRSQIINAVKVVNPRDYPNTAKGRRQYESDLEAAKFVQAQQEASYKEFYESPEQGAIREREAGLNPDLIGLQNAGESSDTPASDTVPGQSLPTIGQIGINALSAVFNVASALDTISSLPLKLSGARLSNAGQRLINIGQGQSNRINEILETNSLVESVEKYISESLATAMQDHYLSGSTEDFDFDSWFSDDANFADLKSIYSSVSNTGIFESILTSTRKRRLAYQKNAVEVQRGYAAGNLDFGKISGNPVFSFNQQKQAAQMMPFMDAMNKAQLLKDQLAQAQSVWQMAYLQASDPILAAEAGDSKLNFDKTYFDNADAALAAAAENYLNQLLGISYSLESEINRNLYSVYTKNPMSDEASAAAYLYGSNGGKNWSDVFLLNNLESFRNMVESDEQLKEYMVKTESWKRADMIWKNANGSVNAASNVIGAVTGFKGL